MLRDTLSMRGRIGRLHFLVGSILLRVLAPVLFLAVMVVGPGLTDPRPHDPTPYVLIAVVALGFAIAWVWLGVSLHVRRIRDIGWSPRWIVAGWLAFRIVDAVLPMWFRALVANHALHLGLVLVGYAFWLILLIAPGRDGGVDDAAPRPPRLEPRGNGAPRLAQAGFGRRGLG